VPGEFVGEGGSTSEGSRSWKRSEDGNGYVQCVTAVYALARDQSPRVACLGRQVLRIMGVESAQIVVAAKAGANGAVSHERNPSVPALPPTSPVPGILQRSSSWVASTRGGYILNIIFFAWVYFGDRIRTFFSTLEQKMFCLEPMVLQKALLVREKCEQIRIDNHQRRWYLS
jgi:hypothetical protein